MTDVPTTALTIYDCASGPTALATSGSPVTVDLGPRLYRVTTGGTAGTEEISLTAPDLPLAGFMNDTLVGLRITFSLAAQTDPSDVVRIAPAAGSLSISVPRPLFGTTTLDSVLLDFVGAAASFVWVGDEWMLDSGITDGNYTAVYLDGQTISVGDTNARGADGSGVLAQIRGGNGAGSANGGDVHIRPGSGGGSGGTAGLTVLHNIASADPLIFGAVFTDGPLVSGTAMQLWVSAGPA